MEVGISWYLCAHVAGGGVIKQQPSDFIVQEVDGSDQIVGFHGNDTTIPSVDDREAMVHRMICGKSGGEKKEPFVFDEPSEGWQHDLTHLVHDIPDALGAFESITKGTENEYLIKAPVEARERVYLQVCIQNCFPALACRMVKSKDAENTSYISITMDHLYKKFINVGISEPNATRLLAFIRLGATHPLAKHGVRMEHEDTKEARTLLHRQISQCTKALKTSTESSRDHVSQLVVYFSPKTKKRKRTELEPYLQFVLEKNNLEHFSCLEHLGRLLKRPVSVFGYAGTKDKVAITRQLVTVTGVDPLSLLAVNKSSTVTPTSSFRIGCLQYTDRPLTLGSSHGNRFTIIIRNLNSISTQDMRDRVESVRKMGFINYFGFQRVGVPSAKVRPHHIGELLIAQKWKQAVINLFTPTDLDSPEVVSIKQAYLDTPNDIDAVLKLIPHTTRVLQVERAVLMGLKRFGVEAYESALETIPFGRRTMYLHAYQSYIFNMAASARMREGGNKVLEGDLVRMSTDKNEPIVVATRELAEQLNAQPQSLIHVVLPLVGTKVLYPANAIGTHIDEWMVDHGTKQSLQSSGILKGAYRRLIEYPRHLTWRWKDDVESKTAVELQFELGCGSFATMCLREIMGINYH